MRTLVWSLLLLATSCSSRALSLDRDATTDTGDSAVIDGVPATDGPAASETGRGACPPATGANPAALCLFGPSSSLPETGVLDLRGMVGGIDLVQQAQPPNIFRCNGQVSHFLIINEESGRQWRIGFDLGNDDTAKVQQAISPESFGKPVRVRFRWGGRFSRTLGFTLSDERGLIVAIDDGSALVREDTPSLPIAQGPVWCTDELACGTRQHHALIAGPPPGVVIAPGVLGNVNVGGERYAVRALDNYVWERLRCTDFAGMRSWAAWRQR